MYTFIDSIEDLAFLNKELLQKSFLGLDTEFRRTHKDNMRLALLQINDGEEIYLIDAIILNDPQEHVSFLFSDSVTKIFHSCKEDLEAIYSWTKQEMVNIFDTQLANSFLENDYSISYQSLVERKLGISLDKKETRSNWIRRPLSDEQLKYAALDVEYLLHIYECQKTQLAKQNKLDWLNQDITRLLNLTFSNQLNNLEVTRTIPREQENLLLYELNSAVEKIALREGINSTLFFSKKVQKEFLRTVLFYGVESACNEITDWRKELIMSDLVSLLK